MGPLEVNRATHSELIANAEKFGDLAWGTHEEFRATMRHVSKLLTLIAASREYQFA